MPILVLHRFRLLALLAIGGLALGEPPARAAKTPRNHPGDNSRWHVAETENFRVLNYGPRAADAAIGSECEALRTRLSARWLGESPATWRPKCDLILHPSDASYDREVGAGGQSTIASALVDRRRRQVSLRRIDVRATRTDWQRLALAHELTHVILAERFAQQELPRWLDEGIAILADSKSKRARHVQRAGRNVAEGSHVPLAELLLLEGYPPARQWGAFYDQSAALVEFLVAEQGHRRLLEFVELAHQHGYDHAFQAVYAMHPTELERRWHEMLERSRPEDSAAEATGRWKLTDMGG